MADWTNIPDATFDPDRPVLGSTHLAIVKNFEALAEGSAGAPQIKRIAIEGANYQVFTSSGTWTKPAGISNVFVEVYGGGAGGGAFRGGTVSLAGGTGGLFLFALIDGALVGSTVAVTVGAGGAAVIRTTSGTTAGNAGGNSSFGSFLATSQPTIGNGSFRGIGVSGSAGGSTVYGGGAGGGAFRDDAAGTNGSSAGGVSIRNGNGGAGASSITGNATASAGVIPSGGGGSAASGGGTVTSGAGARGEVRVWSW